MRKNCPKHGEFEDVMSTDPAFLERIESLFFGRDFRAAEDKDVHRHGTEHQVWTRCSFDCRPDQPLQHDVQSMLHGRKSGWLRSRATFEDTKAILDRAVSFKPRRQVIILFSGGEPTLSPYYLDAVAYAKKIGFYQFWRRRMESASPKIPSSAKPRRLRDNTVSIYSLTA